MNTFRCLIDLSSIISPANNIVKITNPMQKKRRCDYSINILLNHITSSRLDDVGLQLWSGCFLLADFVINSRSSFMDVVILELGTGAGFVAAVLKYLVGNHRGVVFTDYKECIVKLAVENVDRNSHLLLQSFLPLFESTASPFPATNTHTMSRVCGRILDWSSDLNPRSMSHTMVDSEMAESGWTMEDFHMLQSNRTIFLAADVLYDDTLTIHFFKKIAQMIMRHDEYLILTMEKRVNFSVHLLREVATCYELFLFIIHHDSMSATTTQEMVGGLLSQQSGVAYPADRMLEDLEFIRSRRLRGGQIPLHDIPQFIRSYERNEYMEIWKISCLQS